MRYPSSSSFLSTTEDGKEKRQHSRPTRCRRSEGKKKESHWEEERRQNEEEANFLRASDILFLPSSSSLILFSRRHLFSSLFLFDGFTRQDPFLLPPSHPWCPWDHPLQKKGRRRHRPKRESLVELCWVGKTKIQHAPSPYSRNFRLESSRKT